MNGAKFFLRNIQNQILVLEVPGAGGFPRPEAVWQISPVLQPLGEPGVLTEARPERQQQAVPVLFSCISFSWELPTLFN